MISFVPMINLKLPYSPNDMSPIDLKEALEQTQLLLENGVVVPKHTSLIYSRGVIFFFIDRRANIIYNTQAVPSFAFTNLPSAVAGFERLNKRPVNFNETITIRQDKYLLRSVVVSEVNDLASQTDLVVGSSTLIMIHKNYQENRLNDEFFMYDPYSVVKPTQDVNRVIKRYNPIHTIGNIGITSEEAGFTDIARTRGIVFMYELIKDVSAGVITY